MASIAESAGTAATHYLQFDMTWASIALLYYDYTLTFTREVKYIWGSKITYSTLLYIFCRYALLANVLYLLAFSNVIHDCDFWYKFVATLSVFGRAAIIATLIARTHAVCARTRVILVLLILLGLSCVVADAAHVPGEACINSTNAPIANFLRSLLTIIFETSVAIITTFRTFQAMRISGRWRKRSLIYLIFEEGILYFCLISILTTTSVILDLRAPAGFLQRLLDGLTLPLSGFLTARFLLHLRAWKDTHSGIIIVSITDSGFEFGGWDQGSATPNRSKPVPECTTEVTTLISTHEFGEDPVDLARRMSNPTVVEIRIQKVQEDSDDDDTLAPQI